jgi:hypothetical protein
MQRKSNRMSFQIDHGVERNQLMNEREDTVETQPRGTSPGLPLSHFQNRRKRNDWTMGIDTNRGPRPNLFSRLKRSSRVIFVAGAAIGVGLLLGMMVLSIFSNLDQDVQTQVPSGVHINNSQQQEQEASPTDTSNEDVGAASAENTPLIIPSGNVENGVVELSSRSYFVVQAGAFSDLVAAREVKQMHVSVGWAGLLLEGTEPYRLYTGISTTKEDATLIGRYYQENGVDVYVKEHVTPNLSEAKIEADEKSLKLFPAFLTKGDQLLAKLGEISARGIMNEEYQLSLAEWNEVKDIHRVYLQEGQQVFAAWTKDEKAFGEQMMFQMTAGVNALEEFRKQNHVTYLWQVQQAALHYVNQYEQMMEKLTQE